MHNEKLISEWHRYHMLELQYACMVVMKLTDMNTLQSCKVCDKILSKVPNKHIYMLGFCTPLRNQKY
jgi:hypothetical protein